MSLSGDINTTSTSLANIKQAIITKGITPTGNITTYANAILNIPSSSGIGIPREVVNGVYQMPTSSFTFSLPSNATDIAQNAICYAFVGCPSLTSVDLSSLTTVSGTNAMENAFGYCSNLTSIDLSSLTTVNAAAAMLYAFAGCDSLTSIDLSSLTTVIGYQAMAYVFAECQNLTSIDLSSLTTVNGNFAMEGAFGYCSNLTTLSFPALTSNSFGSKTNQFDNMLLEVPECTVHFPSNLQSVIGSWSSVTSGFGGMNTTVLFDLPATE